MEYSQASLTESQHPALRCVEVGLIKKFSLPTSNLTTTALVTGNSDLVCRNKVRTSTYDWKLLCQRRGHYNTFPSHWVQFSSRPQGALLVCSAVLSDLILSCDVVNMLASECFFYGQWCNLQVTKGISIV